LKARADDVLPLDFSRTLGLFFATAIAERVGCHLPLLWLSGKSGIRLLLPAADGANACCIRAFGQVVAEHGPIDQWARRLEAAHPMSRRAVGAAYSREKRRRSQAFRVLNRPAGGALY